MHRLILTATTIALLSQTACAGETPTTANETGPIPIKMADGKVDGTKVTPYNMSWAQCSFADGVWTNNPDMNEEVILIGENMMRLRRVSSDSTGAKQVGSIFFDRRSMSPIHMEIEVFGPDGSQQVMITYALNGEGHLATLSQGGQTQSKEGAISASMYDGSAMGLPLMTLDYSKGAYAFDSSMMSMKATYKTIATPVGTEIIRFGDAEIEAEMVDVEWLHNESGDVYAPGPEGSGGRYWLVKNPPEGFPHVPRYKTDTYAVEFVQSVCPVKEAADADAE